MTLPVRDEIFYLIPIFYPSASWRMPTAQTQGRKYYPNKNDIGNLNSLSLNISNG